MSYAYVASPYSSNDENIRMDRYVLVADFIKWCLHSQDEVYSPIAHWHHIVRLHNLPFRADYFLTQNLAMLRQAREVYVLQLPGWETSFGVKGEIQLARELNMRVSYFVPVKARPGYYVKYKVPFAENSY